MIWRDRNLKFGPNYDLEENNLEKKLKIWRGAAESPEIVENFLLKTKSNLHYGKKRERSPTVASSSPLATPGTALASPYVKER